MNRLERVASQIVAILTPEELPSGIEDDSSEDVVRKSLLTQGPKEVTKSFMVPGGEGPEQVKYVVIFKKVPITFASIPRGSWEVEFTRVGVPKGKTMAVMQGVAAAIRDFVSEFSPTGLTYQPTSKSRSKLYKAMVQRLLPEARLEARDPTRFYIRLKPR